METSLAVRSDRLTLRRRARFTSTTIKISESATPAATPVQRARFHSMGWSALRSASWGSVATGIEGSVGRRPPSGIVDGDVSMVSGPPGSVGGDLEGVRRAVRLNSSRLVSSAAFCTPGSAVCSLAICSTRCRIGSSSAKSMARSTWWPRSLISSRGLRLRASTMLSYTSAVIIALDATPLTLSTGGVGRYTWELALALAAEYPEDQYWLLSDQAFSVPGILPRNLHTGSGPQNPAERKWWLWGLGREMRRRRVDLFHGTDYSVPYLRRRPSVMTLHDLSPWLDRDWQPEASRVRRRTPLLLR